jgi:hypothetical protein
MEGWIKLHRKSYENFLYRENRPHTRREAWEDMISFANYRDESVLIGNEKIEVKRGQSIRSLETWGKMFLWDKSKVKRFFDLLKSEKMIVAENMHKTTRITICNYESYQGDQNADETQMTCERNADETPAITNKESKEIKKKRSINTSTEKFDFKKFIIGLGVDEKVANDWLQVRKTKRAANTETAFDALVREINKTGAEANKCVKMAAEKSWQGFKAEWYFNEITKNGYDSKDRGYSPASSTRQQAFVDHIKSKLENSNNNQV